MTLFRRLRTSAHHLSALLLLTFTMLGLFPADAFAQSETATLSGTVMDRSGAVVTDVDIEVTNSETNIAVRTTTNNAGIYVIPGLKPGRYRISVGKQGFKRVVVTGIILNVQDVINRNFNLDLGAVSESITVTAEAANVNTTSASVSTVIDRNFVESLPLNGRSFNTLLQLTPGVVIAPAASAGAPGQFSIAGQRSTSNNFVVDGVSANFGVSQYLGLNGTGTGMAQAFSALGQTSSLVSVDALQEFRIETSSFAAEFGRAPGGQVMLTTRSGTNAFHGGLFDYFRNDAMDANDWFANNIGRPRAPERHNDFGGFLGGPILKDKTFFFFSYEGARLRLPKTQRTSVPSEFARNAAPASIAPFLNTYSTPNGPVSADGYTAQFTGSYSNRGTFDANSIRLDHKFNDKISVFAHYNYAPSQYASPLTGVGSVFLSTVNTQTVTLGLNQSITRDVWNSVRANYSRQGSSLAYGKESAQSEGATSLDPTLAISPLSADNVLLQFNTLDTTYYNIGPDAKNTSRQINLVDDVSVAVGVHRLKFGIDYRAILLDETPANYIVGATGASVQSLINNGLASLYISTYNPSHFLAHAFSIYGQDAWQLNRRLTLTYGLRWELNPAPSPRDHTTVTAWRNISDPATLTLAPQGRPIWDTVYSNFSPRIGAAYQLTDKGDFVLRGGFGIFYDLGLGTVSNLGYLFPNSASSSQPSVPLPISDITPYLPSTSLAPPYGLTGGFDPNLKSPRSYQWNAAIEKSFGGDQTISATYVGQAGRDLLRQSAIYRPNPNFKDDFLLTDNASRSNYNALQLQYRRPLAGRLHALLNYTWSHSLDDASNDVIAGLPANVISSASDYASSSFDVRQSFSGAVSFAIPGVTQSGPIHSITSDWSIDTVVVARTGFPFNGVVVFASPDPGFRAQSRPDRVLGQPYWVSDPSAPGGKSLNPAAFAVPSAIRQGTESRNDIPGFGMTQVDLSLARQFSLSDRIKLQFRTDAFNILNHPNFSNPFAYVEFGPSFLESSQMLNGGLGGLNSLFQEGGPRSLQVSLKLTF